MIEFKNVTKQFDGGTTVVKSLDFHIKKGEFFVIIGPSGSGKTTTLKMINRLTDITDGTIWIDQKRISEYDIHELRWNIGYVLQQIALFPHMTIGENIAIVPELKSWNQEKTNERIDELLTMVGLEPSIYKNRKPSELSGGQQQRVGVIRALAADPEIIIMDEPFSALDPITREKLQDDILELQQKIKKTIVFVTHDIKEALKLGDRICIMKEGEIVQIGTPKEIVNNPVNEFVKDFIGEKEGNLIESVNIEEIFMNSTERNTNLKLIDTVNNEVELVEILRVLSNQEEVSVKKDGEVIGVLNRQTLIQHLLNNLQKGRKDK
ncbi:ABC transporter ATP-binding protein [Niallia circulans]|uniref:ABC transporter ATP-binding protein n=1 Tax=Niallia circulans TaxID=1397 RepID=UPI0015612BC9|nr:ABC transporter ATP-binding protein [Niallia circulans]NRG33091.1 ABC transporter ATP-binding protein [Niallia circulans]